VKGLLLALALLLGGVLVLEWHSWSPRDAVPTAPAAAGPATAGRDAASTDLGGVALEPPPQEDYASVVERPLFLPERRPPPPEEAEEPIAEEAPMTELDGVDLTAVVITPAVVSAWVRAPGENEVKRLRLGDEFDGWTVKTIAPDELVLERQGETNRLSLRDYENAPPPIPPTRMPDRPRRGAAKPGEGRREPPGRRRADGQDEADGNAAGQAPTPRSRTSARRQSAERTNRPTPIRQPSRR
jgi:hypothetical protein